MRRSDRQMPERDMKPAARGVKLFYLTVTTCVGLTCLYVYRDSDLIGSAPAYVIPFTKDVLSRLIVLENEAKPVAESTNMSTIQRLRKMQVVHHCKTMVDHISQTALNKATDHIIWDRQHDLIYCPVPKNGCSFWKRVFSILSRHREGSIVFNMSSTDIHVNKHGVSYLGDLTTYQKLRVLHNSTKFVFARDPYERLFSGYLDKLFAPDAQHHIYVAEYSRQHPSSGKDRRGAGWRPGNNGGGGSVDVSSGTGGERASLCEPEDYGVTFSEFLAYVSNADEIPVNDHFKKQHLICLPCRVGYDFVGKMETFRQDADFILRSVGVDPASLWGPEDRFQENSDVSIMNDVVHRSFTRCTRPWCRCLSRYRLMLRLWVLFQARGFLSVDVPFPLSRAQSGNVTLERFQALARKAYISVPQDRRADVKRQRHQAMMEAYHSVKPALLARVQSYVSEDCELFGYECSVTERFSPSTFPDRLRFRFEEKLND